jgi:hypothetical protein
MTYRPLFCAEESGLEGIHLATPKQRSNRPLPFGGSCKAVSYSISTSEGSTGHTASLSNYTPAKVFARET